MGRRMMRLVLSIVISSAALLQAQTSSGPVTLDQAINEAMDRNLNLLAARYDVTVADARMITARLRPNPVLSLSGDHFDWLGTGYNAQNNAGPVEYAARTDFLLERGRKREARIAVASQDRELA